MSANRRTPSCSSPLHLLLAAVLLFAAGPGRAEPAKIRDNLFLLEEAYNQEPGVIQHIQTLQAGRDGWSWSFTEEWPVPHDRHQLSFTLPLLGLDGTARPALGDVLLNYRVQALGLGGVGALAVAPRLSLVLPTGRWQTEAGRGALGVQTNLPVSIDLSRAFVVHLNVGFTATPSARSATGERKATWDTAGGGALVWLPVQWANALVEVIHATTEEITGPGQSRRDARVVVNPGVRFALDFDWGLQVVPGLSVPVVLGGGRPETSLFAYLSLEHPLWK